MPSTHVNPKVLVVDDEIVIRDILSRYFRRRGAEVFQAESGEKAVEIFKETRPHVVLMDIKMAGMNGVEALKLMRGIFPQFKAIVISAIKDDAIFEQCRELEVVEYIVKPFDISYLDTRLAGKVLW